MGLAAMGAPEDEYDWLVSPISDWLRENLTPANLAERIGHELATHPAGRGLVHLDFAEGLVAWYHSDSAESN